MANAEETEVKKEQEMRCVEGIRGFMERPESSGRLRFSNSVCLCGRKRVFEMFMKNWMRVVVAVAVLSLVTASNAFASPVSFTEDFSSGLGSNLAYGWYNPGWTSPSVNISTATGACVFNGNNADRDYVNSVGADYGVSDKDWTATVQVNMGGGVDYASCFFGLGPGTSGGYGYPYYSEPKTSPVVYLRLWAAESETSNGVTVIAGGAETKYHPVTVDANTTYLYQLAYTASTNQLAVKFGTQLDGSDLQTLQTVALSGYGYTSTNSSIFFGGNNAGTFDNLVVTVVPEPASTVLLGVGLFGLLAYAWRKRK